MSNSAFIFRARSFTAIGVLLVISVYYKKLGHCLKLLVPKYHSDPSNGLGDIPEKVYSAELKPTVAPERTSGEPRGPGRDGTLGGPAPCEVPTHPARTAHRRLFLSTVPRITEKSIEPHKVFTGNRLREID